MRLSFSFTGENNISRAAVLNQQEMYDEHQQLQHQDGEAQHDYNKHRYDYDDDDRGEGEHDGDCCTREDSDGLVEGTIVSGGGSSASAEGGGKVP